jgi:hypothetical protein
VVGLGLYSKLPDQGSSNVRVVELELEGIDWCSACGEGICCCDGIEIVVCTESDDFDRLAFREDGWDR